MSLLAALTGTSALAGSSSVDIANDEVLDGIIGVRATLPADYRNVLKRRRIQLDPASQRLSIVWLDGQGREIFSRDDLTGVALDINSATTTPPLPADGSGKSFFVPYHRLDLPPGSHKLTLELHLDAGLASGPVLLSRHHELTVRMPTLDWVFASIEQPPRDSGGIVWRARLGQDVMMEGSPASPTVVVLAEHDEVSLEVFDSSSLRWTHLDRSSLAQAAKRAGLPGSAVRALQVRTRPPHVQSPHMTTSPSSYRGQQGHKVDARWSLSGGSPEVALEMQVSATASTSDGQHMQLPGWALSTVPGRSSVFVPSWGLPEEWTTGSAARLGFEVMVRGGKRSPLSRDLVLGGHEEGVQLNIPSDPAPMIARQVSSTVVDEDGLMLDLTYDWTLPEGMPSLLPGVPLQIHHRLTSARVQPLSTPAALYTSCSQGGCSDSWSSRAVGTRSGRTKVRVPLALFDPNRRNAIEIDVIAKPKGYRGAATALAVDTELPVARAVRLSLKKGQFSCAPGGSVRVAWVARDGEELAALAARPCNGTVRWSKNEALSTTAFEGDTLLLSIEQDGKVMRRTPIRADVRTGSWLFEAPFAGVQSLQGKLDVQ